jgi:hypothetical protein
MKASSFHVMVGAATGAIAGGIARSVTGGGVPGAMIGGLIGGSFAALATARRRKTQASIIVGVGLLFLCAKMIFHTMHARPLLDFLQSATPDLCIKPHVMKGDPMVKGLEPDLHVCLEIIPLKTDTFETLEKIKKEGEDRKCVVYSFGIANNWLFDELMVKHGCDVFSFDPSMDGILVCFSECTTC